MNGIYSLRDLERSCRYDVRFLYILLKEAGEIDLVNLFVDGTKIEANANKYSFVWKKSTNKFEAKLDIKIEKVREKLPFKRILSY